MHKTSFGEKKYVQHKHKSHFVFVLHKHEFSFGNAPIISNDPPLYMAVRAQQLTVHSPPFGDKPLQVQISLPERVLWPRFNARIYVPER